MIESVMKDSPQIDSHLNRVLKEIIRNISRDSPRLNHDIYETYKNIERKIQFFNIMHVYGKEDNLELYIFIKNSKMALYEKYPDILPIDRWVSYPCGQVRTFKYAEKLLQQIEYLVEKLLNLLNQQIAKDYAVGSKKYLEAKKSIENNSLQLN